MNLTLEGLLYCLQIMVTFGFAGPKIAQAERQRSLSRNPAWVLANPGFLRTHRVVAVWPLRAAGLLSLALLGAALAMGNSSFLYAVHGPVFVLLMVGLIAYYAKTEAKVQAQIPKDALQRAPLIPRTASRFLSSGLVIPLIGLFLAALIVNAGGFLSGSLSPERMYGNVTILIVMAGGTWYGLLYAVRRQPYRTTLETDTLGRRFELRIVLMAAYYFAILGLYYTIGSLGSAPVFSLPPTLVHAFFEGQSFPWPNFFRDAQYRIVDYSATVLVVAMLLGTVTSKFYRRVLAFQFEAPAPLP